MSRLDELKAEILNVREQNQSVLNALRGRQEFVDSVIPAIQTLVQKQGKRTAHEESSGQSYAKWELEDFAGFHFVCEYGTMGQGGHEITISCNLRGKVTTVFQAEGQLSLESKDCRIVVFFEEGHNQIWQGPLRRALASADAIFASKEKEIQEMAQASDDLAQAERQLAESKELAARLRLDV